MKCKHAQSYQKMFDHKSIDQFIPFDCVTNYHREITDNAQLKKAKFQRNISLNQRGNTLTNAVPERYS